MAVVRMLSDQIMHKTGKQSSPGKQLRVLSNQHASLHGTHGKPCHGPVLSVLFHPVLLFDERNDILRKLLQKQLMPQTELTRIGFHHHHAVCHHDQHGHSLSFCQKIIHDMVHLALPDPSPLIFSEAVLQVQNRIFRSAFVISRRHIADAGFRPSRRPGLEIFMTDRAVRHILHQAEILHRSHLYVIGRPAVPVPDGKEGA